MVKMHNVENRKGQMRKQRGEKRGEREIYKREKGGGRGEKEELVEESEDEGNLDGEGVKKKRGERGEKEEFVEEREEEGKLDGEGE